MKEDAITGKPPEDRTIMFDHHIRYHLNVSCNEGEIATFNSKKYKWVLENLLILENRMYENLAHLM